MADRSDGFVRMLKSGFLAAAPHNVRLLGVGADGLAFRARLSPATVPAIAAIYGETPRALLAMPVHHSPYVTTCP